MMIRVMEKNRNRKGDMESGVGRRVYLRKGEFRAVFDISFLGIEL